MRPIVILCIAYWIFLTVLLIVSNPAAMVGMQSVPIFPWGKFGIHLSFFVVLGVLANFSGWPKRLSWPLVAFMAAYGIATELLQLLVPRRTGRMTDAIEDILGIVIGSGIYWLVWQVKGRKGEEVLSKNAGEE
jgi:hypothetical protein